MFGPILNENLPDESMLCGTSMLTSLLCSYAGRELVGNNIIDCDLCNIECARNPKYKEENNNGKI